MSAVDARLVADGDHDHGDDEPADGADRWAWVSWVLLLGAVAPIVGSAATIVHLLRDEDFTSSWFADPAGPPTTLADRWQAVGLTTDWRVPALATALGLLALGAAVTVGRSHWPVGAGLRQAVGVAAAAAALLTTTATGVSLWVLLSGPTARQELGLDPWIRREGLGEWLPEGSLALLAVVLELAVVLALAATRLPSDEWVGEDAGQRARAE